MAGQDVHIAAYGAVLREDYHFTRLHIPDHLAPQRLKGAGFGGGTPAAPHPAEAKGPVTVGIPCGDQLFAVQDVYKRQVRSFLLSLL